MTVINYETSETFLDVFGNELVGDSVVIASKLLRQHHVDYRIADIGFMVFDIDNDGNDIWTNVTEWTFDRLVSWLGY